MTISDRIFEILKNKKMSQKDFACATGIAQSTISDWHKKGTNPTSDKIMIICDVLGVSPYYLLSGITSNICDTNEMSYRIISESTDEAEILDLYDSLNANMKQRVLGYIKALQEF